MGKNGKNERFAVAVDYLFQTKLISSQKDLCTKIGLTEPTYSRIKTGKRIVSDDTIRKLNDAFNGIFNMAYFRDESETLLNDSNEEQPGPHVEPEHEMISRLLAAKEETIEALRQQLALKDEIIQAKDQLIASLRHQIPYSTIDEPCRMAAEP